MEGRDFAFQEVVEVPAAGDVPQDMGSLFDRVKGIKRRAHPVNGALDGFDEFSQAIHAGGLELDLNVHLFPLNEGEWWKFPENRLFCHSRHFRFCHKGFHNKKRMDILTF